MYNDIYNNLIFLINKPCIFCEICMPQSESPRFDSSHRLKYTYSSSTPERFWNPHQTPVFIMYFGLSFRKQSGIDVRLTSYPRSVSMLRMLATLSPVAKRLNGVARLTEYTENSLSCRPTFDSKIRIINSTWTNHNARLTSGENVLLKLGRRNLLTNFEQSSFLVIKYLGSCNGMHQAQFTSSSVKITNPVSHLFPYTGKISLFVKQYQGLGSTTLKAPTGLADS
jgi:hypothetical protein